MVPLYHKVRIPLRQVVDLTIALDQALRTLPIQSIKTDQLEWDIELVALEALRDGFGSSDLGEKARLDLLTLALPRFVWRVRAMHSGKLAFDLILDATDLLQGKLVRRLVAYDARICMDVATVLPLSAQLFDPILLPTISAFEDYLKG